MKLGAPRSVESDKHSQDFYRINISVPQQALRVLQECHIHHFSITRTVDVNTHHDIPLPGFHPVVHTYQLNIDPILFTAKR